MRLAAPGVLAAAALVACGPSPAPVPAVADPVLAEARQADAREDAEEPAATEREAAIAPREIGDPRPVTAGKVETIATLDPPARMRAIRELVAATADAPGRGEAYLAALHGTSDADALRVLTTVFATGILGDEGRGVRDEFLAVLRDDSIIERRVAAAKAVFAICEDEADELPRDVAETVRTLLREEKEPEIRNALLNTFEPLWDKPAEFEAARPANVRIPEARGADRTARLLLRAQEMLAIDGAAGLIRRIEKSEDAAERAELAKAIATALGPGPAGGPFAEGTPRRLIDRALRIGVVRFDVLYRAAADAKDRRALVRAAADGVFRVLDPADPAARAGWYRGRAAIDGDEANRGWLERVAAAVAARGDVAAALAVEP